jgi:hypothetical protein
MYFLGRRGNNLPVKRSLGTDETFGEQHFGYRDLVEFDGNKFATENTAATTSASTLSVRNRHHPKSVFKSRRAQEPTAGTNGASAAWLSFATPHRCGSFSVITSGSKSLGPRRRSSPGNNNPNRLR